MEDVLFLAPCKPVAAPTPVQRLCRAIARTWQRLGHDEREAYLSKATDCADLERRQREWDRPCSPRLPANLSGW